MNEEKTASGEQAEAFQKIEALRNPAPPAAGLKAVHESAALSALPGLAPIAISGKDAADYLHRRLAQSVKNLPVGRGAQALQLSGDGRMECDLLLYRRGEAEFIALVEESLAEAAAELLDKYVLMDEVEVRGGAANSATLTLLGPRAAGVIDLILGAEARAACEEDPWSAVTGEVDGGVLEIFRDGRWSTPCFQVVVPLSAISSITARIAESVENVGGAVISGEVLDYVRIENGVTRFGSDTTDRTIPLEANLRPALDLDKGCFPGQEFLARINNLGHPARVLARLRFGGSARPESGDAVAGGDESEGSAGEVTSVRCLEGVDEGLALATLPWKLRELREAGIQASSGVVDARVELLGEYPDASGKKAAP